MIKSKFLSNFKIFFPRLCCRVNYTHCLELMKVILLPCNLLTHYLMEEEEEEGMRFVLAERERFSISSYCL